MVAGEIPDRPAMDEENAVSWKQDSSPQDTGNAAALHDATLRTSRRSHDNALLLNQDPALAVKAIISSSPPVHFSSLHHDHHHHDDHHSASHNEVSPSLPLYAPPRQRQRWGDAQVAPHTNWGDIFFDLFYVAAAYNLGTVLAADPTLTGLLYTAGLFLPIQTLWSFKLVHDSRFYHHDDLFHRCYEIALLLALATAVLHIKPVAILSHPTQSLDMFVYCMGVGVAYLLAQGRLIEVMICQRYGNAPHLYPEAYQSSRNDVFMYLGNGASFVVAAVYTAWQYYHHNDNEMQVDKAATSGLHQRFLADATDGESIYGETQPSSDHVAIWVLLAGTLVGALARLSRIGTKFLSKQSHYEYVLVTCSRREKVFPRSAKTKCHGDFSFLTSY
jgi:hypothetical protein